jgi:Zn-dependent M28 family amino/carboxypeptidase
VPTILVAAEHYGRLSRLLDRNVPVTLEIDAKVRFHNDDLNSFNILGEIPGSDPALKDEVVMIGAHFDSWHMGTGATDNGAGSATMLEAMRILRALDLKPRRTIRIGLWTGEEQGLIGSRQYVAKHLATRDSTGLHTTAEWDGFQAYFNVDNGGGKIRGVFQQSNPAIGPIFEAWMAPFNDGGMKTLTITNTGGTDHLAFDGVGLPGFQFIQDPIEYGTRTHHTNMDVYERIQPDDMMWNSAVLAAFAWQAAQRDEKLPRKPLPSPPVGTQAP